MTWPAALKLDGDADFTTVIAGACTAGTVTDDGADTTGVVDPGGSPCAVAVFDTDPASTLACVVTYVAVHVSPAPGASDGRGQLTADNPGRPVSVTPTLDSVTFPVFVTANW